MKALKHFRTYIILAVIVFLILAGFAVYTFPKGFTSLVSGKTTSITNYLVNVETGEAANLPLDDEAKIKELTAILSGYRYRTTIALPGSYPTYPNDISHILLVFSSNDGDRVVQLSSDGTILVDYKEYHIGLWGDAQDIELYREVESYFKK